MSALDLPTNVSPFDALRQVDELGQEFWSARDLMVPLRYDRWENFEEVISRAYLAAKNSGMDPDQAFSRRHEKGTGGRPRLDYRLSRYGAYLVAMNGDPRKPEVAAAQSYFAIKARKQEIAEDRSRAGDDLALMEHMIASIRADRQRLAAVEAVQSGQAAEQRELRSRMDGIEGLHDWFSALAYARMNGLPTETGFLRRLGTAAARITRRGGTEPAKTQHALYGTVNTYPITALDQAAEALGVSS